MKDIISRKPIVPGKHFQIILLAGCLHIFLFSVQSLYAGTLAECLLEALNSADNSVTVGQIRGQCQDLAGSTEETGGDGPEELVLKTAKSRKPAYFPHRKHQEKYSCDKCHHGKDTSGKLVKYNENTVIQKCTSCHNEHMPNDQLNGFQLIGHKLCRGCHRNNQDITSAKCSTCHRKNL